MNEARQPKSLDDLLDRIAAAAEGEERVSLEEILEEMGRRSFGPVLLAAGLVTLAPIVGDIPGVPTSMGVLVVLAAGQMFVGRTRLWLPRWLLERAVDRSKLETALRWLRRPARLVDRVIVRRLEAVLAIGGNRVIAAACLLVGAVMPMLEFVPFSATAAGLVLTLLGLALVARDGLLASVSLALMAVGAALLVANLA